MRVTLVSDAIYPWHTGGKEIRYHELTNGLVSRGHDVEIATMRWWGSEQVPGGGARYLALSPRLEMYENGRRSLKQGILFALSCLRLLRVRTELIEADHMPYLQLFPIWLVSRVKRVPLTVTWHEYWGKDTWVRYMGRAGLLAAALERVATKLPDHIISVSESTTEALKRAKVPASRITTAENAVSARAGTGERDRNRVNAISVGRLIDHKRFDIALETAAELQRRGASVRLDIVGDGPERKRLEVRSSELGLEDVVTFHGTLPTQQELWDLIGEANVLIAPSEREGYGLAVAEALTLGTPAVVSDHPDNASQDLIDEETGAVAAAGNPESFADAVERTLGLENAKVAACFAERCGGDGWGTVVDTYENTYRTLTAKKSTR